MGFCVGSEDPNPVPHALSATSPLRAGASGHAPHQTPTLPELPGPKTLTVYSSLGCVHLSVSYPLPLFLLSYVDKVFCIPDSLELTR